MVIDIEDPETLAPLDRLQVGIFQNDDQTLLLVLDVLRR